MEMYMFTDLVEWPAVLKSVTYSGAPKRSRVFVSIEAAIEELKSGRMIVVVDDEDRENEGDLTMAAEMITPEAINFMRPTHAA